MSTSTKRAWQRPVAAAVVLSMALAPSAAMASDYPLEPRESENSIAQSVQIRVNADGTPNGDAVDFRWSVTQITAQGDPNSTLTVKVPEDGALLHSLQNFGTIPQEDGQGVFDIDLNDSGFGTARSVSLFPQDMVPPVELKAEFTLDGEPITAQDLVGKDGLVTATYTVTNTTKQELTVPITSVTGDEIEKTVEADVPFVVQAETFLPQTFAGLNTGSGLAGADGRGNWQVVWIGLPFAPLSKDGTATFGWAANVTDAVIPSMVIQALPVYIPEGGEEEEQDAANEEARQAALGSVPPPDVSGDVAAIQGGVADVISGLEELTKGGGEDPLQKVQDNLNEFFQTFGANIQNVATLLDPENADGVTAQLIALQLTLEEANAKLAALGEQLTPENLDNLDKLARNWTDLADLIAALSEELPQLIAVLESGDLGALVDCSVPNPANDEPGPPVAVGTLNQELVGGNYRGFKNTYKDLPTDNNNVDDSWTSGGGTPTPAAYWGAAMGKETDGVGAWETPGLPSNQSFCDGALSIAPGLPQYEDALKQLKAANEEVQKLAAIPALTPENAEQVQASLQFLSTNLAGIVTTLTPLTEALSKTIESLVGSITELQVQVQIIADGLSSTEVDLPSLDAVLASVVESVIASPGGQQLTGGLDQVSTGISGVKTELGAYVANLLVVLQAAKVEVDAAIESGTEAVGGVIDTADNLKAEVAGLVTAAHTSPLPYGGDPADAPEGTKLAGAYEFRVDPADTETSATLPRILVSILLLVVAGLVGNWALKRRTVAVAGAAAPAGDMATAPADAYVPAPVPEVPDAHETAVIPDAGEAVDEAAGSVEDVAGDATDAAEAAAEGAAEGAPAAGDAAGDTTDAVADAVEDASGTDQPGGDLPGAEERP